MIPETVDNTEQFAFVVSDRDDLFFILLIDRNDITEGVPIQPLWLRACADEESRLALQQWFGVRRSAWQNLGRLAQAVGYEAFAEHIQGLMTEAPPGIYDATAVIRLDDERQIELGMHLSTDRGPRVESVYVHTFATAQHRRRFFDWFHKGENHFESEAFVHTAVEQGTLALATKLDAIAAGQASSRRRRNATWNGKALRPPDEHSVRCDADDVEMAVSLQTDGP